MGTSWPRRVTILFVLLLLCAVTVSLPAIRTPILRGMGWALVIDEPVGGPVDIIVLTVDVDGAGVLEAADLVHRGIATQVAVFAEPPNKVGREFIRRGVPYEDAAAQSIRQLKSLGVGNVEQISRAVVGTGDEGDLLPLWCDQRQFRSVVVVSDPDHSRRLRRVLNRTMKGHPTRVTIRNSRYSEFDPNRWWHTRASVRIEIVELEKLLFDVLRHPLS